MKYAEFIIDNNKIEFFNTVFGVEGVLLNGKQVSKKFSFSGFSHDIKMNSESLTLKSKYKPFSDNKVNLQLFKEGKLIQKQNVEINKKHRFYWMFFGFLTGISIYKLLVYLVDNFAF
jgi:hypothetical protein